MLFDDLKKIIKHGTLCVKKLNFCKSRHIRDVLIFTIFFANRVHCEFTDLQNVCSCKMQIYEKLFFREFIKPRKIYHGKNFRKIKITRI